MLDEQEAKAQLIAELRESQRKLSTLLAHLPGMVYRRANNARGAIESVSDGCASVTGYRSSDLIHGAGGAYADLIHPEDQPRVRTTIEKALDEKAQFEVLYRIRGAHGEERWLFDTGSGVLDADGRVVAIEGYAVDITLRVKIEEQLQAYQERLGELVRERTMAWAEANEQLKAEIEERRQAQESLKAVLQSSEHDRRLLAYDIHDGVTQPLAGALMQLQASQRLIAEDPVRSGEMLEDGLQALRQAYAETRRLIAGVRSPILEQSGLEAALADLASSARKRSSRTVDFQSELQCNRLPPVLENAIYRIAQESLNNACQHSRSKKVLMTLVQDGDVILLEVRYWGRGFDPAAVRQGMLGLEGIRERARLLDGTAVIDSQRRQGTTVRVTLPLPASVAARGCRLAGALRDGGPAR